MLFILTALWQYLYASRLFTLYTITYIATTPHNNNEHEVNWGKNEKYYIKN